MPGLQRLAGAGMHQRVDGIERTLQQQLDLAAGILEREQARGNHARVIEDQQVAGRDQLRKVAHAPIGEHAPLAPSSVSSRLADRSASGCWAMSSSGSS